MTTQHSEGSLLEEKPLKMATAIDKEARNGTAETNGHPAPGTATPESLAEDIPIHRAEKSVSPKTTVASIAQNEDAFSANQAVADDTRDVEKSEAEPAVTPAKMDSDLPSDVDMVDAPTKSPAPDASISGKVPEAAPDSTADAPAKEDVVMDDAPSQAEPSVADQAESTQDTAISDTQVATPPSLAVDVPISSIAADTQPMPATADNSMSEVSAKVSRERDADSEDEPVAKRARVDTAADQVEVKMAKKDDGADRNKAAGATLSVYGENGNPKSLTDDSLNGNPITDWQNKQIRITLAGVKKTKAGGMFKSSVENLWPELWAGYTARVSNPTDISAMEKRLRGDGPKYATMGEFKSDLDLLVSNSVLFNGEGHDVTIAAKSTRQAILSRMSQQLAAEPRPAKSNDAATPPQKAPVVDSPAFAIPASSNGVPLIRRDSTKPDSRTKRPVKPAHPKDLVYETKRKKMSPELRFCEEVLGEIRKPKYFEYNGPFQQPVDPVELNIPQYHKIIKKPMDLQTMSNKMSNGEYASLKEFEKDFDLIVKNCKTFNGENHLVYSQALRLQTQFRREMNKKDDWMARHAPAAAATSQATTSPRPKDDSEDDEAESEAEPELDEEQKAAQSRLATIQRRLEEEQKKITEMVNSGTAALDDVEIAQAVVAMLQKNLLQERSKLANAPAKKAAKPKPAKSKKASVGGGGGSSKKAAPGPSDNKAAPKKSGTKKATKRKMGVLEKEIIAGGIAELDGQQLEKAIDIIKKDTGQGENDSGELELDIELLTEDALTKLYDLVTKTFPHLRAEKETTLAESSPQVAAPRNKTSAKTKKNKPMSKMEQERRIAQLNELRAQAGPRASGSQEPMESIEGTGRASTDPTPQADHDSEDEESSEEE
ncbi:hypothetical protein B0T26DRAFT_743448 [Lasiosphaeria miniovina]|uniref:Bromodomain-containing factor 1 n=1 Tax=Lasiosphaeria miniovina TaxID=1954250 RepID=A0AA39ZYH3_9PEZI|nr:uncharacterized protein B0T26DRAFT_743448 [Lasiosphaeria miniovina]KAK0705914.1 hypothetical protein B0T26DRAFT_743448 [Lasiosphaeria miniovina]